MNIINIAMEPTQNIFLRCPTWHPNQNRRAIMEIQKKFWILVAIYIAMLCILWLFLIMEISKLL